MAELTDVERIKKESNKLRGKLVEGLFSEESGFEKDDTQIIKLHGLYQQKNRDLAKDEAFHSFMLRGRIPGGRVNAYQYLAWDELGDKYGGQSLRATTRQTLQLHGLLKGDLKDVIKKIDEIKHTTIGACGDVVRNVTQAVNPWGRDDLYQLDEIAQLLSDHFKFNSNAYAEIWLDGEKVDHSQEVEPIYGDTYLPRKFKMAVTLAGINDIDIYTNDMSFAATIGDDGNVDGAFLFAGGGLGMTHNRPATFPRAADLIGWIAKDQFITAAEAIVQIHKEWGDRTNRKHARLKYVLADHGVEWFQDQVETIAKLKLDHRELPEWNTPSYLGWIERVDGKWALGLHILAGRIRNDGDNLIKTALKEIIEKYQLDVQFTAAQDLILLGVETADKDGIEAILDGYNVPWRPKHKIYEKAIACVSLPTCTLAVTEAERVFKGVLDSFQELSVKYNVADRAPVIRMTGCPNGCARPYSAEIGIVGQMKNKYAIFLGGHQEGLRVGRLFTQKVPLEELANQLDEVFKVWSEESHANENLGDYIARLGFDVFKDKFNV